MIETDFYILSQEQHDQYNTEAQSLGVTLDHFLLEWCDIQGPYVTTD
jgi:hypothetical protein